MSDMKDFILRTENITAAITLLGAMQGALLTFVKGAEMLKGEQPLNDETVLRLLTDSRAGQLTALEQYEAEIAARKRTVMVGSPPTGTVLKATP